MLASITNKQIKLLMVLRDWPHVIARWDHGDLSWLFNHGLAKGQKASGVDGRLSSNIIWSISEKGRAFLADERGAR